MTMCSGVDAHSLDLEREGLLAGCAPEGRAERERLIEFLLERGVGVDEMRQAAAGDRLPMLASERALSGEARYTVRDLAQSAAVSAEALTEVRHAMGLRCPDVDERCFGDRDLAWARLVGRLLGSGMPRTQFVESMRVLGRGLAQTARSVRETLAAAIMEAGVDEHRLAEASARAAEQLLPLTGPLMQETLRMHLLEQVRDEQNTVAALRRSGRLPATREIAVCFADLVGFTGLGERLPVDEVERVATTLEQLAAELVEPPVQLVKAIGDAVMLTAPDPMALIATALGLVERTAATGDLPELRVGMAHGTATNRSGDWYGAPVNLASRITAAAPPGCVICTEEMRSVAGDRYRWTSLGARQLRGIEDPVPLIRVERAQETSP